MSHDHNTGCIATCPVMKWFSSQHANSYSDSSLSSWQSHQWGCSCNDSGRRLGIFNLRQSLLAGADETLTANHSIFICRDGSLVNILSLSDGKYDCYDKLDEMTCLGEKGKANEENNCAKKCLRSDCACDPLMEQLENGGCKLFYLPLKENPLTLSESKHRLENTDVNKSCFNMECLYEIDNRKDRNILGCKNGTHLAHCETFECIWDTFKCPDSYCIKLRYLCDGYWDCPYGLDEKSCDVTKHPGFYRCLNTSIVIQPKSVCDNVTDCPSEDDEVNCAYSRVMCPYNCTCLLHGIHHSMNVTLSSDVCKHCIGNHWLVHPLYIDSLLQMMLKHILASE